MSITLHRHVNLDISINRSIQLVPQLILSREEEMHRQREEDNSTGKCTADGAPRGVKRPVAFRSVADPTINNGR